MKPKTSPSLNINAAVSFGGAIIILSIVTKFLHVSWSDQFIVFAFSLEALLFILMGIQKLREAPEQETVIVSNQGSAVDSEFNANLIHALENLNKNTIANTNIVGSLVNGLGANHLIEQLNKVNTLAEIDVAELQTQINVTTEKYKVLNEKIGSVTKVYVAQLDAFKSN